MLHFHLRINLFSIQLDNLASLILNLNKVLIIYILNTKKIILLIIIILLYRIRINLGVKLYHLILLKLYYKSSI